MGPLDRIIQIKKICGEKQGAFYHDFLGPRGLQGIHMDALKPKNSKSITFTVRGGFFTFWAILAHSAPRRATEPEET